MLGIPVRELQHRVSAAEFAEYLAYFSVEPWPGERADINTGILASLLANIHKGSKQKYFEISDFRTDYWKQSTVAPETELSPEMIKAQMDGVKASFENMR